MNFNEILNNYMKQLSCSSKELIDISGISSAVISRYRNGTRTPKLNSQNFDALLNALYEISQKKGIDISKETLKLNLANPLLKVDIDFESLREHLNTIITVLKINVSELSRMLGFDSSMISKIRSGKRNPADPKGFIDSVAKFIVRKYKSDSDKATIANLISCSTEDLNNSSVYLTKLIAWFFSYNDIENNYNIDNFLINLDTFDLDEYIKAIHFDELKIPVIPFYKIHSKTYYGIEEMKQGELDFFKATVLSKSNEPIFMCSDMPMEDMAEDIEFGKKWMFAIAMSLKKGLHLNIIHNLDRPFNEMMLGLESWIPIYMTGQVSPYYFPNIQNSIYCHFNYVSGNVALSRRMY